MAKAEIPDWFDLKIYQKPLSSNQWLARICFRVGYLAFKPLFRERTEQEEMFRFYSGIFPQFNLPDCNTDPLPVRSMIAADLAVFSAFWSRDQSWQALYQKMCSTAGKVDPKLLFDEVLDIYSSGATLKKDVLCNAGRWIESQPYPFCHGAPITVNLSNDDETIRQAFNVWLAGARNEMSERFKKPVSDEDFQKWQKYRVMAAFDLCQWAEIKGFRYTNNQLANALFPPESIEYEDRDVDMAERVRKLVKPLMSQCFTHETVRLLEAAARLEMHLEQVNTSTQ